MRMGVHMLLALGLVAVAQPQSGPPPPLTDRQKVLEQESLAQLLNVRRVHVDRLIGGETAAQMRDMIISSLQAAKLFVVTENPERADTFLRGSAEDLVFTDTFSSNEGLNVRGNLGLGSDQTRGTTSRRGVSAGVGAGENESSRIAERKHEASAAVRLVNKEGDVIWSTTQESTGGKFRGASADVSDKITRQLVSDFERAKKPLPK